MQEVPRRERRKESRDTRALMEAERESESRKRVYTGGIHAAGVATRVSANDSLDPGLSEAARERERDLSFLTDAKRKIDCSGSPASGSQE